MVATRAHALLVSGNVGYRKTAWQSPEWQEYWSKTYPARLALDGNTDPDLDQNSCSHPTASSGTDAWWMVDLGDKYRIDSVTIYNRKKCSLNYFYTCSCIHRDGINVLFSLVGWAACRMFVFVCLSIQQERRHYKLLYNVVSNPQDCFRRFTLYSTADLFYRTPPKPQRLLNNRSTGFETGFSKSKVRSSSHCQD